AGTIGPWVIAIGAYRYAFVAAGWALPWLRGDLPRRQSRSAVAALQGIVLIVAATGVVPTPVIALSLAVLTWSFARDVRYLHRMGARQRAAVRTAPAAEPLVGAGRS
ncbi:hypothetical protein SAMN05443668_1041, partial [Cryptosporangium aurantiacum]